jgi:hypothetical protein
VCALKPGETIIPDESGLTVYDLAGPDEGCPEVFETCLSKKGAVWVKTLRDNAEAIQARCHATVSGATAK